MPGSARTTFTRWSTTATGLACSEILPDEKGATCAGFLLRAANYFAAAGITRFQRVITDTPQLPPLSRRRRRDHRPGAKHTFIRPHCPWQNGKAESFNRTLQIEWAYRQVFTSNAERSRSSCPWLERYNTQRRHTALGGLPPISRLSPT